MKKRFIYLGLSVFILLSGCTGNQAMDETDHSSITVIGADSEIIERSETISDIVVDLYGIDDATTIILNDIALIAVKIAYDQKLTDETIKTIESVVSTDDSNIKEILITDKAKIFSDIDNILSELLQGKTYDSLVDEINKIKNKISW